MPGLTGSVARVLQVHPTLQCNLKCLHCYSSSGPAWRGGIAIETLRQAVTDAAREGYNTMGVSGGEPLMYGSLEPLLDAARAAGLRTTITTNGMLLTRPRAARLRDRVDLVAISLDGWPESHNRMRGHPHAFGMMSRNLRYLHEAGIPFGFIFTLTQHNANELEWVAAFACEAGARLLQIHPLEAAGRARETLAGSAPDGQEASFAYLVAARLQDALGSSLVIQLDLADLEALRAAPERAFAAGAAFSPDAPLSDALSPLVIEADGTLVPLQWGFPRRFALGNLADASLTELGRRWLRDRQESFRELGRGVLEQAKEESPLAFFNWYGAMASAAAAHSPLTQTA